MGFQGYELEYMLSAKNLVENGSFSMAVVPEDVPGLQPRPPHGVVLPRHNLLQVFFTVPLYLAGMPFNEALGSIDSGFQHLPMGSIFFISLLNPLMTVLAGMLILHIGTALGFSRKAALTGGVVYCIATMAWPYAAAGMEPLQITALLLSFSCLVQLERDRSWKTVLFTGGALTCLIHTKISAPLPAFPAATAALAILVWSDTRHKVGKIAVYAAILAGSLLLWFQLYRLRSQGMYSSGFFSNFKPELITRNIIAFIISPGKSIFVYNPILLWCLPGIALFFRKHRLLAVVMSVTGILILFLTACWDWSIIEESWGPRYLAPIVSIILIMGMSRFHLEPTLRSKRSIFFMGVLLVSVLVQAPGVLYHNAGILQTVGSSDVPILDLSTWAADLSPVVVGYHMIFNKFREAFGEPMEPYIWHHYRGVVGMGTGPSVAVFENHHLNRPETLIYYIDHFYRSARDPGDLGRDRPALIVIWTVVTLGLLGAILGFLLLLGVFRDVSHE